MKTDNKLYQLWICGDAHLLVDYGQIHSIASGIKAVLLKNLILENKVPGIVELIPSNTSLLISFDPRVTSAEALKEQVTHMLDDDIEKRTNIVVPSRIIEFPILFNDPWTRAAIDDYRKNVKDKPNDIDFIIEQNNLSGLDELITYLTTPYYMVTYLSMGPGLPSTVCMDPRYVLSVPKYNPPRTSTPPLSIGIGGSNVSLYSSSSPGGYQLFGMLAAPLLQFEQKLPDFKDSPVLARVGDRFKYKSVTRDEFDAIRAQCEEGTYRYNIDADAVFDLKEYEDTVRGFSKASSNPLSRLFKRGGNR